VKLFTEILALIFLRLAMSINSDQVIRATVLSLQAAGCSITWPQKWASPNEQAATFNAARQHEETSR